MTLYLHEKILAWIDRHLLALSIAAAILTVFIGWHIAWWMINPVPLQPYGCCAMSDYQYP
jgi:hypothetical protein